MRIVHATADFHAQASTGIASVNSKAQFGEPQL